jgi:hypothetical protein
MGTGYDERSLPGMRGYRDILQNGEEEDVR